MKELINEGYEIKDLIATQYNTLKDAIRQFCDRVRYNAKNNHYNFIKSNGVSFIFETLKYNFKCSVKMDSSRKMTVHLTAVSKKNNPTQYCGEIHVIDLDSIELQIKEIKRLISESCSTKEFIKYKDSERKANHTKGRLYNKVVDLINLATIKFKQYFL